MGEGTQIDGYLNLRGIEFEFEAEDDSHCVLHEAYHEADGRPQTRSANPVFGIWTVDDERGAPARAVEPVRRAFAELPINVKEFG